MTEMLLQKLEDKAMNMLAELEKLRAEVKNLRSENSSLRAEKDNNSRKMQDLVSLLDSPLTENSSDASYLQEETEHAA